MANCSNAGHLLRCYRMQWFHCQIALGFIISTKTNNSIIFSSQRIHLFCPVFIVWPHDGQSNLLVYILICFSAGSLSMSGIKFGHCFEEAVLGKHITKPALGGILLICLMICVSIQTSYLSEQGLWYFQYLCSHSQVVFPFPCCCHHLLCHSFQRKAA